ncbi:MAG TPA: hypothetical protein VJV78_42680, partial [Polyangiales bacterium]|nr:hypothetical protein [Polyangiales bacterium]
MFAFGAQKRLSVPATSEQTLRSLLGPILTPELERQWLEHGSSETHYQAAGLGGYRATFSPLGSGGFAVVFVEAAAVVSAAPSPSPAPRETIPAPTPTTEPPP